MKNIWDYLRISLWIHSFYMFVAGLVITYIVQSNYVLNWDSFWIPVISAIIAYLLGHITMSNFKGIAAKLGHFNLSDVYATCVNYAYTVVLTTLATIITNHQQVSWKTLWLPILNLLLPYFVKTIFTNSSGQLMQKEAEPTIIQK